MGGDSGSGGAGGGGVSGVSSDGSPQGSPGGMGGGPGVGNPSSSVGGGGGNQGGFGGLGIGNPGSYGGQQSVGAPGHAGGYEGAGGISGQAEDPQAYSVAETIAAMTPREQESFFTSVVEPAYDKHFGWQGKIASGIFGFAINKGLNAAIPGLGTLSKITGTTKAITDKINDMAAHQTLSEALGLSTEYAGVDEGAHGGESVEDTLKRAVESGKSGKQIINAINQTVALNGGSIMGFWDDIIGETSANAASGAAGTAADYQQRALNYLQERDIVPRGFSEGAMKRLGGFYGLQGGEEDVMNRYQESPLYANLQAGREQGEDAILRNASMTGGLRSGNVQEALYDYNVNSERNALGQYMQGLDQFTGYPSYATQIAGQTAGIGQTLAQGQIASAQAQQSGTSNIIGLAGSVYQGLGGYQGIKDIATDIYSLF